MSKLIDVKRPKRSKEEINKGCEVCTSDDVYPYGLRLSFESPEWDEIPKLATFKVGDRISIVAEAVVTSIRVSERRGGDDERSMEMQIEKIACDSFKNKPLENMSPAEYKAERSSK